MPELRRQFEIDNYLGRWAKALKSLHKLNADDELRAYAVKHVLYKDAIDVYKYQPEQLHEITRLYGDYLHDQSKFKEAGIGMLLATQLLPLRESKQHQSFIVLTHAQPTSPSHSTQTHTKRTNSPTSGANLSIARRWYLSPLTSSPTTQAH